MAAGWGCFLRNLSMDDSMGGGKVSCPAEVFILSRQACISIAVMPSLVLLGSLRLTLCLIRLARLPAAAVCWPAVIAASSAIIQYCWFLMWDLVRSPKLISSRNLLSSGTSSGGVSASSSIVRQMSSNFFLCRYPQSLLCSVKFRYIHYEWVMWRSLVISDLVQLEPLR